MKKAISFALILLLLFMTLSGCSSPKSNFTAALRQFSLKEQYTLNIKTDIRELSSRYQKLLSIDDSELQTNYLAVKVSADKAEKTSIAKINLNMDDLPLTVDILQDNKTGRIYIPVNNLYQLNEQSKQGLSKTSQKVLTAVLENNQDLKAKYLDVYEAIQNLSNMTINSEMVKKQAEDMHRLEKQTVSSIYDFLNQISDNRFELNKGGDISLTIPKSDLKQLVSEIVAIWDKDDAAVNLLSEGKEISRNDAREIWKELKDTTQSYFKELVENEAKKLEIKLTIKPDSEDGFKEFDIRTVYSDTSSDDRFDITVKASMLPYEAVPEIPRNKDIVNKKELDKAVSDGLKKYLETHPS
ncbi:lipoprotein [Listeria floridensis FSL S10-1187]|uniref:Lipoprotein n=1 Tax=Listeria floridensis FSL S10-1187 TaxID=1265817 RepID=A0ABN0REN2_9LIST|nr:hypothetical protein [Listeria floridensis]EUJ31381.1 lipoprotein [Listeria floridensis FSL S10-1187]